MRKKHIFPLFFRKNRYICRCKRPIAMKATAIEGDCKSPYSVPANCKFAGTAIPIFNFMSNPGHVTVIIVNDDYDGISGQDGVSVRPYGFWPNPAKDILNLQYSPDVTPTRIELFDMQGRLVRSQTTGLESVGMEGLATGTYTLRVTLQGGKVFSDKVVKE